MEKYTDSDFIGFTFNGKHSSEFGLLRVSDGDRYEDTLVLNLSDEAAEIPGGPGHYYWGEQIGERKFNINVAYDEVSEVDKRNIRKWLHPDDRLHELIFDEKPYVKYWVKVGKEINTKEICFYENNKRIYKGEFEIPFIAYMPYGIVIEKNLDKYRNSNKNEWADSSGLLPNFDTRGFDKFIRQNENYQAILYNPGDVESDFILTFNKKPRIISFTKSKQSSSSFINITKSNMDNNSLERGDYCIFTNVKNHYYVQKQIKGTPSQVQVIDKGQEIDIGYIEENNHKFDFISNNTGNRFPIYYYGTSQQLTYYYTCSNIKNISSSFITYTTDERKIIVKPLKNNEVLINFLEDSGIIIHGIVPEVVQTADQISGLNILLGLSQDEINWYNNKVLSIIILGDSKAQREILSNECEIRLDTFKHNISYRKKGKPGQEWNSINSVIKGDFFKIPITLTEDRPLFFMIKEGIQKNIDEEYFIQLKYPYLYI